MGMTVINCKLRETVFLFNHILQFLPQQDGKKNIADKNWRVLRPRMWGWKIFTKRTDKSSLKIPSRNKKIVRGLRSLIYMKLEIFQSYFYLQCNLNFEVSLCIFCCKFHGCWKSRSKTYRTWTPEKYEGFNIMVTSKVALGELPAPISVSQEQHVMPLPLTIN